MKAVNLLPAERRQVAGNAPVASLNSRLLPLALGATAAVVAAALAFAAHSASTSVTKHRRELSTLRTQLASTRPSKAALPASTLATADARRAAIVSVLQRRLDWDGFLGSISRVMPENVWLASLTANPAGAAAAPPPAASTASTTSGAATATTPFAISGYTYSQAAVARLLDRIALVPGLSGVELTGSSLTPLGSRSVFQFSIGASMTPMGGTS